LTVRYLFEIPFAYSNGTLVNLPLSEGEQELLCPFSLSINSLHFTATIPNFEIEVGRLWVHVFMGHTPKQKMENYHELRDLTAALMLKEAQSHKWDLQGLSDALLSDAEREFCRASFAIDIIDVLRSDQTREQEYSRELPPDLCVFS